LLGSGNQMVLSSTLGMLVFQSKFLDKKSIWVREL
jgi:hypothetical protein